MDCEGAIRARRLSISNRELIVAVIRNDVVQLDDLLKTDVDVNFKDRDGNTALHWAVACGNVKTVELLLSKGASTHEKNNKAESPLEIGKRKNMREIIDILEPPKPSDHSCPIERPNDSAPGDAHENNENMLERRKNAVHGNIYQLKLLMLFLYRGVSHKYSFRLGTEIQEAKKFDDLVFEYDVRGERVYRLLQAKHRLDESKTINAGNLLSENDGDFSLAKYFFSYLALKKDKLFSGGKVKDVTICTNIDFDIQNLERNGISVERIEERDEILDVKSARKESARYRFNESIVNLMKPKLKSYNSPRFRRTENHTDSDIGEFIKRLVFAVNQPNEDELGHIVKNEISREFDFITAENVYNKFFMSMLNWLQGKEKGIFLSYEDGKEFFVEINRGIQFWFGVKNPIESFTGRTEFLNNLHTIIRAKDTKDEKSQFVCVSGLGGVGKSELARKYVSEYSQDYDNKIVWINAESYETLADSFRRLACDQLKISTLNADNKEKKLNSTVEDVYAFFSDKKCLFIFDNAEKYKSQDEFDNGIEAFLPSLPDARNRLHVLITSRNQKWPKNIKVLSLDVFSENEATDFVKKSLSLKGNEECEEVKKLVNELQLFPLALQQAVAYIGLQDEKLKNVGSDFKISNYLKKCKQKTKEYLQFTEGNDNDYSKTTYSTWNITIEAIRQREHGVEACELLEILSYFAPADIYVSTIKRLVKDEITLASVIDLLKQYSIVNVENAKLSLHRLVLKMIRLHLQEQKREQEVLHKALNLFCTCALISENIEHAISVWNNSSKYCKLVDKFSALPNGIIHFLLGNWRFEEAELFGVKASKRLDALTSKSHATKLNLIATKKSAATALLSRGKYDLSVKYYEDIYSLQKRMLGPKSLEALKSKKDVVRAFMDSGQYDRALELCEEILKIEHKLLKKFDPNILYTQHEKAKILNYQGKYKEALPLLQEVVNLREIIHGKNHPETLTAKSSLASVLANLSKFAEASKLEKEVSIKEALYFDKHHPDQLASRANKGITLLQQNKHEEARLLLQEVYEGYKKYLGEDHPDALSVRRNLGEALKGVGRIDEALKIFRSVHKKQKEILGPDRPDSIFTQNSIGHILRMKNQYTEALKLFKDSLERSKITFGEEHPTTLRAVNVIASILVDQEKYDEALKYSQDIVEIQEKTLGDDQLDTLSTKHLIGMIYHKKGQLDKALKIYKEICDKERDSAHPHSIRTKESLVEILLDQHKYEEALKVRKELLQARIIAYGERDKDTFLTKIAIADLYHRTKKNFSALKILREIASTADDEILEYLDAEKFNKWLDNLEIETGVLFGIMEKDEAGLLQKLFDAGRDVNSADEDDCTLLHYAVMNQQMSIIDVLLKNGADVTLVAFNGNTPLHEAAIIESLDIVKLLLKHGSIYNARNKEDATPLDLSEDGSVRRLLTIVEELFDYAKKKDARIIEKLESLEPDELEAVQKTRNSQKLTFVQIVIMHRQKDFSDKVLGIIRGK
ncbi:uncharacterized protein LOC100678007 [Nasonia vitripennis]|uniref:NB-ARC domain-containing protein n=1 Tax=Nasonia vitripennis TaxID=7425 RepID=A0A7M7H470_NASVI|nr:uncharacterized protein LOC100678007 [Nasonia vitripennis]